MQSTGISFVCATKNRDGELRRLMECLKNQTVQNFELIIVDQNTTDLIESLIQEYRDSFSVVHVKVPFSSNTKARNLGARNASNPWIGFPDDDSWMPNDFVEKLIGCIQSADRLDGVFTNWRDPSSDKVMFSFESGLMKMEDPFTLASCICIFLSRQSFFSVGGFDERLGLGEGTLLKAGEEQDLLLKMMHVNKKILKTPQLEVYHLIQERKWDQSFTQRIIGQGACDISFLRKYNGWLKAYSTIVYWMAGIIANLFRGRIKNVKWYYYKLIGGVFYQFDVR